MAHLQLKRLIAEDKCDKSIFADFLPKIIDIIHDTFYKISNITTIDMSFHQDKQNTNLIQESDLKMSFVTQTVTLFYTYK